MANEKLAKNMYMAWSGKTIARSSSYSLSLTKGTVDVSNLQTEGYAEFLTDTKNWTASVDAYFLYEGDVSGSTEVNYFDILEDMLSSDESVEIFIKDKDLTTGTKYVYGQALLTSVDFSGDVGGAITFSAQLQGTGTLTVATIS